MRFPLPFAAGLFAFALSALALSAPALSGCAVKAEPHHALADTSWRFVTIDGKAPASGAARLEFHESRLGATMGCNRMGGPWRVEGKRLMAGPLAQTEMYCEGPVWAQEQAVATLLSAAPRLTVEKDRLVLRSSGHSATLERVSRPQPGS
ncbi:MAG: META domain-containing protein [Novosphingobium sp.]|nr:META domain-containing protein [Novosphingobium sp.]